MWLSGSCKCQPPVTGMLTPTQRFTVCVGPAEHDGAVTGALAAGEGLPAPEELSAVMASPTQHQLPMPASSRGISAASPGDVSTECYGIGILYGLRTVQHVSLSLC